MARTVPIAALAALLCYGAWAQPPADSPVFEVASVKLAPPPDPGRGFSVSFRGGPGSEDPTRIDYRNVSLFNLVTLAYGVERSQISAPDGMGTEKYNIDARVPPGATRAQFRLMLQNLLAERFKLQVHRESKEVLQYSLTVSRNGPKLKPHVEAPPPTDANQPPPGVQGPPKTDSSGYPILRRGMGMAIMNGKARYQADGGELARLVGLLTGQLGAPVKDDTGLQGKYDIALSWLASAPGAEPDSDAGPDLFAAVEEQLGLKLERKKGPVEMLVIDHVEKLPTGN